MRLHGTRWGRTTWATALGVGGLLLLAACSSSGGPGNSSTNQSSSSTIKIGVITELTGAGSSGYTTTENGIKAYADAVNAAGGVNGHQISYVMADTTSTPQGALTAAQKLVQRDHVFAIIADSSDFFGAYKYLLQVGVPVLGVGQDGPEWSDKANTNLFTVNGVYNPAWVFSTYGEFVKTVGGTTCGSVGYIESPSASQSSLAFNKSCVAAGLKSPYHTDVHFGSTDVGPIAIKMKADGVDSAFLATVPSTGFALAAELKNQGVKSAAIILPDGYGGDLLASKPTVRAAQGFYFATQQQPIELNTPATQTMVRRFAAVGEKGIPNYAESVAYLAMTGLAAGIKAAGNDLSQQNFMAQLRKVTDFDAEGLLAPNKISFSNYAPTRLCSWFVKLVGDKFVPVKGAAPVCGHKLSG